MSMRGSILWTKEGDHFYEQLDEYDNDMPRIYIEIDKKNIVEKEDGERCIILSIKGDSELAKYIKILQGKGL